VTAVDLGVAECNKGLAGSRSYLWTRDSSTTLDPIVELKIIKDSTAESPAGFERLNRNLLKGSEMEAYICFRRGRDEDPIGSLFVFYNNSCPEALEAVLEPVHVAGDESIKLCFKRVPRSGLWSGAELSVGHFLDAQFDGRWLVAQVTAVDADTITVQIKGSPPPSARLVTWTFSWECTEFPNITLACKVKLLLDN
jgi:hypothetical protein